MINQKEISNSINRVIDREGFFVISISIKGDNKIFVFADSINGITIDDCAELGTRIRQEVPGLDLYDLQVSSPGAGEAFKVKEQYKKNIGKKVKVKTRDNRSFSGTLFAVDQESFSLKEPADSKKKEEERIATFNFKDIISTKRIISFN